VATEHDLPARLAADLDGAFEAVVLTYQDRLFGFALRLTGSRPDAEEIAQDAFVRAYRALADYPPERVRVLALRPWLYRIALNVTRNRARGVRPRLVPLDGEREDGEPAAVEPAEDERRGPEATAERKEQGAELAALVAALPERYRAAVVLRHVAGLSYAEAADALGQPVGTVKANVHRGVRRLRAALVATPGGSGTDGTG
jgi:RNA polymerase sigma-70 factor, ECF subfamily